jgi:hypothetical protein
MKRLQSIRAYVLLVIIVFVVTSMDIGAQRRAGGGGAARAGGAGSAGSAGRVNFGATQSSFRSTQSVNRSVDANRDIDRNVNVDRDVNINRGIDVNTNYDRWGHPIARGVTAGVAVGTAVAMLPSGCTTVVVDGIGYSQCGSTWYQPFYSGTSVQYAVVSPPQ